MIKTHPLEKWRKKNKTTKSSICKLLGIKEEKYEKYIKYEELPSVAFFEKINHIGKITINLKDLDFLYSTLDRKSPICQCVKEKLHFNKIRLKQIAPSLNISIATMSKKLKNNSLTEEEINIVVNFIKNYQSEKINDLM